VAAASAVRRLLNEVRYIEQRRPALQQDAHIGRGIPVVIELEQEVGAVDQRLPDLAGRERGVGVEQWLESVRGRVQGCGPMASPLIATKLHVPKPRGDAVGRPRLRELLLRGTDTKLTLISAPAGFGKTALLAEWLSDPSILGGIVAWLSLDPTDSEPNAFWLHVVAALEAGAVRSGTPALALPDAAAAPDQVFLVALVNAIAASSSPVVLVLDDFHLVENADVQAGVGFIVEHLPSHAHVVISTRADPTLPLARLRARGELVEVRAADLRFTAAETSTYLNDAMGLGLTANDAATLEERTEGWIAALQLAVLSIKGRKDASAFIAEFAGSGRFIVDYLIEEVLERQPDDVRRFLARTCVLKRMSGPLCDAVSGLPGAGRAMLDRLDRQNLFVVPLDDRRQWYRYHHLFADVLVSRLGEDERRDLPQVHRLASDWFELNGERPEAIDHALAAEDFERAAELVEKAIPAMRRDRQEPTMRRWFKALPDRVVRARPVLGVNYAGSLLSGGDLDVDDRLDEAERALAFTTGDDDLERRRLPTAIGMYRAALAQARGDVAGAIVHAQRALDVAMPDDHFGRAGPAGLLGIAHWSRGELDAALPRWTECLDQLGRAGYVADVVGSSIGPAEIHIVQGRLREAARLYEHVLQLAAQHGGKLRGTADVHAAVSRLHVERNDLAAARRHLQISRDLGDVAGLPQHPFRWRAAMAEILMAEGDAEQALRLWHDAERERVGDFFPNARPVAAVRARIRIMLGQLDDAERWARDSGIAVAGELTYLREFEHVTLARLLLARRSAIDEASDLLARLVEAAATGGRNGSVIEISVLQAVALDASGNPAAALVPLKRALELAEPEGHVRVFAGEGDAMAALLKAAVKRGIAPAHARRLLAAIGTPEPRAAPDHPELLEPLSEREVDVLRLLRSDLSGPDMARELAVSLNTVRTHTKNIYEKLGVNSRRAAVRRAEELNLLGRGSR
jgi:LuxR family maltose regulon positive regulatory protein